METNFLHTERLEFRRWSEDDLPLAMGLWGDFAVTKLFDARGSFTPDQVQARLAQEIATQQSFGVQYWPIFLAERFLAERGTHVGCCGLRPYDLSQNIYELGFHIRSDQWGQGFATEAARAVIAHAFETLKVASLFAGHNPENKASRRVLEKLGFRYTHAEFYEPTGLQHPSYLLTKS